MKKTILLIAVVIFTASSFNTYAQTKQEMSTENKAQKKCKKKSEKKFFKYAAACLEIARWT